LIISGIEGVLLEHATVAINQEDYRIFLLLVLLHLILIHSRKHKNIATTSVISSFFILVLVTFPAKNIIKVHFSKLQITEQ
jgi:hypothetical protein